MKDKGLKYIKNMQKAKIIHQKPGESTDKPMSEQLRKKLENEAVKTLTKNTNEEYRRRADKYRELLVKNSGQMLKDFGTVIRYDLRECIAKLTDEYRKESLDRCIEILEEEKIIEYYEPDDMWVIL